MKTEYLITFDEKDDLCSTISRFKNLLSAHSKIGFKDQNKIIYDSTEFHLSIQKGNLPDSSIYYELTVSCEDLNLIEKKKNLLREIRSICQKTSKRNIIILHDGIGEEYCNDAYPIIYKTENLMRKLIAKFMAISIGHDWSNESTPKEVLESVKTPNKHEKSNFLHEVDFIQLSNFLFKSYTKADAKQLIDSLKEKNENDSLTISELKKYIPSTNWEKYFSQKVNCSSEYIKTRWEKLYEYRCQIAHCRGLSYQDFEDLKKISNEVTEKIQTALDSITTVHLNEDDRDAIAENLSIQSNENAANFISKYNQVSALTKSLCEKTSADTDVYYKHPTNTTNIQMQSRYLMNAKGLITRDIVEKIKEAQLFRNKIVHKMGISEVSESELIEHIKNIEDVISFMYSINYENLCDLKGMDLRNGENNDES